MAARFQRLDAQGQAVQPPVHAPQHANHIAQAGRDGGEGQLLTTAEVADLLRYRGKHRLLSVYRFLKLKGITPGRRSKRKLLIRRSAVIRALGLHRKVS